MTTYYKVLKGAYPYHGGCCVYHLPSRFTDGTWQPGRWMPRIRKINPCVQGYHLCDADNLIQWIGPDIYEAEYHGKVIEARDKIVVEQVRLVRKIEAWDDNTARLLACYLTECLRPLITDRRSLNALDTAYRHAIGQASDGTLADAEMHAYLAATESSNLFPAVRGKRNINVARVAWLTTHPRIRHYVGEIVHEVAIAGMYAYVPTIITDGVDRLDIPTPAKRSSYLKSLLGID